MTNLAAVIKSAFQENLALYSDSVNTLKKKVSLIWVETPLKNDYGILVFL